VWFGEYDPCIGHLKGNMTLGTWESVFLKIAFNTLPFKLCFLFFILKKTPIGHFQSHPVNLITITTKPNSCNNTSVTSVCQLFH
jgi:hypothetical protein